jgi:hypothetical protein
MARIKPDSSAVLGGELEFELGSPWDEVMHIV